MYMPEIKMLLYELRDELAREWLTDSVWVSDFVDGPLNDAVSAGPYFRGFHCLNAFSSQQVC